MNMNFITNKIGKFNSHYYSFGIVLDFGIFFCRSVTTTTTTYYANSLEARTKIYSDYFAGEISGNTFSVSLFLF